MDMSIFKKPLAIIAVLAMATSCSTFGGKLASSSKKDEIIVANYSDGKITKSQIIKELDALKAQDKKLADVSFENLSTAQKESLIKRIILKESAIKQAKKDNLDEEDIYVEAFKEFESLILQKQLYLKLAKDATTDEKLQAKYNELVKEAEDKQDFKLGFILLENEKQANNIHGRLMNNPNAFTYYAKNKSVDEVTKKNDGIIDYSIESSFPENVVKITKDLKKGEISKPFAIADKWGIIQLVDKRKAKVKAFGDTKDALSQQMALKAIADFNDNAIKEAKINLVLQ